MPYSSFRKFNQNQDQNQFKIPKAELYWSKNPARGSIIVPNKDSSVKPTGGAEAYYCDLGAVLIVTAKERSGQIRAVSFRNVGNAINENMWTIDSEFPEPEARQLFRKAQLSFGIDNTETLVPKSVLKKVA